MVRKNVGASVSHLILRIFCTSLGDKQLLLFTSFFTTINKLKLAQAWIEIHQNELIADWNLAVKGEPIFKIDPLK